MGHPAQPTEYGPGMITVLCVGLIPAVYLDSYSVFSAAWTPTTQSRIAGAPLAQPELGVVRHPIGLCLAKMAS